MSLYRNILSQALKTSWNNKYLWFFGLFASLIGSGGFEIVGQSASSSSETVMQIAQLLDKNFFSMQTLANTKDIFVNQPLNMAILILVYLIVFAIALFVIWLATVSQVAIVKGSAMAIAKEKHSFSSTIEIGTKKFLPVLMLNVMIKLVFVIMLFFVNLPLLIGVFSGQSTGLSFLYILVYVLVVPTLLLFSFIIKYVIAFVVLKNDDLGMAIKRSLQLFKRNWLISIEMSLLQFVISFVVSILAILILSAMYWPVALVASVVMSSVGIFGAISILFIAAVLAIMFLAFVGAFDSTFQIAAWTGLFVELTGRGGESKLQRVFRRK
ncbi:MAG: hypothetical protein WCG01_02720 [bacterium]